MQNESTVSRRNLLGAAAAGAAAIGASAIVASPAGAASPAGGRGRPDRVPLDKISVQLYTLRNQLAIDLDASLAELREIGYTRVEHAGFVGRTAAEFKAALDAVGIWASSGHVGIPQPFDADAWSASLRDARIPGSGWVTTTTTGSSSGSPTTRRGRAMTC